MSILASLLLVGGAIAAFNLVVDPFYAYPSLDIGGLDSYKQTRAFGVRTQAEILRRGDITHLVLGSSRVLHGLDPGDPAWGDSKPTKVTMLSMLPCELPVVLRYAAQHNHLEEVTLNVDDFTFYFNSTLSRFRGTRFDSTFHPLRYHRANLLSAKATSESLGTLANATRDYFGLNADEHAKVFDPFSVFIRKFGQRHVVKASLRTIIKQKNLVDPQAWQNLDEIFQIARESGFKLRVIMMPVHATLLQSKWEQGKWEHMESLKRRLAVAADATPRAEFWDFLTFNAMTTEPVPTIDQKGRVMQWFWDVNHCNEACGHRVITTFMGSESELPSADQPPIGARLTTQNIQAFLADQRQLREAYLRDHPQDVQMMQQIVKELAETTYESSRDAGLEDER